MSKQSVEVGNIAVGDLPFHSRRGDFYLRVDCAENPSMCTSIVATASPKVVHFPETLTLRLRDSTLEGTVVFTIFELDVIGSQELCHLSLFAKDIIKWSLEDSTKPKRFIMRPQDIHAELDTPPWILLQFDCQVSGDARHLLELGDSHVVRTADWTRSDPGTGRPGFFSDWDVSSFKHKYTLLDPTGGQEVFEPSEEVTNRERHRRCCFRLVFMWLPVGTLLGLLLFWQLASHVEFCYDQFSYVSVAQAMGWSQSHYAKSLPVDQTTLHDLQQECIEEVNASDSLGSPCWPTPQQVLSICSVSPGYQFVLHSNRVRVMCDLLICEFRIKLIVVGTVAVLLVACCCMPLCDGCTNCYQIKARQHQSSREVSRADE